MYHRLSLLAAILAANPAVAAAKRPMTIDDLFRFARVAEPQISPDGKQVVYQVTNVNLGENKSSTSLWLAASDGKSPPRQLTNPSGKKDTHPRWSPDGKQILFESNRSGTGQIWVIDLGGGEARQLTTISTGASNAIWSPDGSSIAFVSAVFPEHSEKPYKESDELNKKKLDEIEKNPVKAKVFTRLFYRHWVEYVEDKRQHLFVLKMPAVPQTGGLADPVDVTPGNRDAYPTSTTFSVGDDFVFSPNGKYLIFTAVPEKDEAWSTNYDLCRVPIDNRSTKWETLTGDNAAADGSPRFSLDGGRLAWRAQKKAGYEADKWDIYVSKCDENGALIGERKNHTSAIDRSVDSFIWLPVAGGILFTCDEGAETATYHLRVNNNAEPQRIFYDREQRGHISSLSAVAAPSDDWGGYHVAFSIARMNAPPEVYVAHPEARFPAGQRMPLVSQANTALLKELDLPRPEPVEVDIEGGQMQMWILKPPGFDPKKKWPVVYLVHGGPQSAWEDGWSFRWVPELWAAQGYVVALPNPRGSTGFGQKFVDEISGDWGGKCYRDLMKGVDYLETLPYVDKERIASAGASFGGYMMNWFAVNTPRFKTLITHCSVWNFESMWGTTDELWFDEFEHGGLPWEKPQKYAEFSPHKKAGNLGKFKTPMLIIHNDLDFRCPIGQGHEMFSALQRLGVPSRFVNFPDEGHWVTKPKNSEFWHKEVFAWLKKHCAPGGK